VPGLSDVVALPRGARFHCADMHIHSYGASHDVRDATITPENIVKTALAQGLGVIAVTDHKKSAMSARPFRPQRELACWLSLASSSRRRKGICWLIFRPWMPCSAIMLGLTSWIVLLRTPDAAMRSWTV